MKKNPHNIIIGRTVFLLMLTAAVVSGLVTPAWAHRVIIFAWVQDGVIYTESKFSGGKPVKDGTIEIYDTDETLLMTGKTDETGEFSFKAPKMSDLRIVLKAGMGHQNEWRLGAGEIAPRGTREATTKQPQPEKDDTSPVTGKTLSMDADMEKAMGKMLDEKLKPVMKKLSEIESKKGPTLTDVFGGIGYILGLMGLGATVHYKRRTGK